MNLIQYIENLKNELENVAQDSITWLDENQESGKEEYEFKLNSLEEIANPILKKLYGNYSDFFNGTQQAIEYIIHTHIRLFS